MPDAAPPRHFTSNYVEHAELRDGTRVVLRLLCPADKELLREGFLRLSQESRYARFFSPKTTLTADELRYLTEIDQETHFAVGAVGAAADGTPVGLGIARFIKLAEPEHTAEAAIAVADEAHGRGLGKLLFLRLCAAATERGIERFRCEVLGSNTSMQHLIETITPDHHVEVGGGVMSIELVVPAVPPAESITNPAPQGGMYKLFRAAAGNAIEWTSTIKRLWGG
ncbi:MAG: GNAT family N-acetyltransferase [Deltaproteobacteria bacterium]|nr:GNAT family N-acetyltransferase [Deltaproteobacteria bacterium]